MGYRLADGSLSTDYKVGDEFVVGETGKGQTFAVNSVVKLKKDDKSRNPRFKLVSGECLGGFLDNGEHFLNWSSLRAVKEKPFTKSDLKDGITATHRNGLESKFLFDQFLAKTLGELDCLKTRCHLREFSGNLKHFDQPEFDIIRVTDRDGTVLFEREPEKVKLELEVTPEQAEAIRKQLGQ